MKTSHNPLTSLVVALVTWLSLLPLGPLVHGDGHLYEAGLVVGVVGLVGVLGTLLKMGRGFTYTAQTVVALGLLIWRGLMLGSPDLPVVDRFPQLVAEASNAIATQMPPVDPVNGLIWVILLLAVLTQLITELLTNVLEQPAWAFAPIALGYVIAGIAYREELELTPFFVVAGSYVLLLLVSTGIGEGHRVARASRGAMFQGMRFVLALVLAVLAIAGAVAIQPALPTGEKRPWESGSGGPIQLGDPTVALNENLRRPDDQPMFTYRTSDGEPTYFRTVALPDLTTDGVRLVPMQLRTSGLEDAYDFPGDEVQVEVQMGQVPSEYLPVPFAVDSFDAEGDWSFDPATLAVVSTGDDRMGQTLDLGYSVVSTKPNPSQEELDAASAGDPDDDIASVVPDLDQEVVALTEEVVAGAETDGQKAQAIQSYLRSAEFEYTLEAPQHPNLDVVSSFLLDEQSGYCIHFASAMMTMARIEGIPSRMAVGFNSGQQLEDGSFQVTSHNMHAWPELYFEELGWVPFEPTPAVAQPPGYTDPDNTEAPSPSPVTSPTPSATPSSEGPGPSESPLLPSPDPDGDGDGPAVGEEPSGWVWPVALVSLGVLVLLAAPMTARAVLARWRLRPSQPPAALAEGAWRELRASFTDAGREWPEGSPGPAGRAAAVPLSDGEALAEAGAIVERTLFSRDDSDASRLPELVHRVKREIARGTSLPGRVFPRSLWRR